MNKEIINLRKRLHYTQQEMSDILGISIRNYQKYESGEITPAQPKQRILERLANGEDVEGITKDETEEEFCLPLLPISAIGGFVSDNDMPVRIEDCERLVIPQLKGTEAEIVIRVSGDSMYPLFPDGTILGIKKIISKEYIRWGECYVISTIDGSIVKKIMPVENDDSHILCISVNSELYPPFKIPKSEILGMFRICGSVYVQIF